MRTCLQKVAQRDVVRWGALIVIGIVLAAGCADSSRRSVSPSSAGVGQAQGEDPLRTQPASAVTPQSDAESQPQNNAAEGPLNSPGGASLDELEAELSEKQASTTTADPLEPVNRAMYGVNDVLYFWVLKPVLQVYVAAVPKPARTGIRNFFHNLTTPARLVNCILQGKSSEADTELCRFAVNTVGGVLGFGDPAHDQWGLKPAEEDLGLTLAAYGLGDGFYLVWPLLGPSTLRDSAGMVGDMFLDPVRYVDPEAASIGISATSAVNGMSFHLGEYESLKAATVDSYIAMREAYLQYRKKQIRGEEQPTDPNSAKP